MTAVTGETGAGKTMLVEALELLVGGRADATIVRPGATEARVDGRFVTGDHELVLTRVVPAEGRSRAYIDGRPTTVGALADARRRSRRPARPARPPEPARRRRPSAPRSTASAASTWRRCARRGRGSPSSTPSWPRSVAPSGSGPGRSTCCATRSSELAAATARRSRRGTPSSSALEDALADAAGHREAGAVGARGARRRRWRPRRARRARCAGLSGRAPFGDVADRLASLLADLDDVVAEVRDIGEAIEEDPARLAEVRARRQLLRDLCRKYGDDVDEVIAYGERGGAPARRAGGLRGAGGRSSTPSAGGRRRRAAGGGRRSGAPGGGRRPGSARR